MLLVVVAEESAIAPKTSLASDAHDDTPTHPPPHSPASLADVPDLRDPALYLDGIPHDLFTFLRRESPVYFNPEPDDPDHEGFWALTRNQDIVQVSKNPKRFSSDSAWGGHRIFDEQRRRLSAAAPAERPEPPEKSDIKSMISMDPPEHSRYRGTILPGVKRRRVTGHGRGHPLSEMGRARSSRTSRPRPEAPVLTASTSSSTSLSSCRSRCSPSCSRFPPHATTTCSRWSNAIVAHRR